MATRNYPTTRDFIPAGLTWGLRSNVFTSTSPYSGDVQTVEVPGARWTCSITYPPTQVGNLAAIEAFWASVRGQVHRVALWHLMRPAPRGTMRGSPTLGATAAQFATTCTIQTTASATVKAGDMLGLGGQLVMVTADATANGSGVMSGVTFEPPLRAQKSSGASVTWDRPTALFLIAESQTSVPYTPKVAPAFGIDLVEVFA